MFVSCYYRSPSLKSPVPPVQWGHMILIWALPCCSNYCKKCGCIFNHECRTSSNPAYIHLSLGIWEKLAWFSLTLLICCHTDQCDVMWAARSTDDNRFECFFWHMRCGMRTSTWSHPCHAVKSPGGLYEMPVKYQERRFPLTAMFPESSVSPPSSDEVAAATAGMFLLRWSRSGSPAGDIRRQSFLRSHGETQF